MLQLLKAPYVSYMHLTVMALYYCRKLSHLLYCRALIEVKVICHLSVYDFRVTSAVTYVLNLQFRKIWHL